MPSAAPAPVGGPFPAHRFWIEWAGVWSEWYHMPCRPDTPW